MLLTIPLQSKEKSVMLGIPTAVGTAQKFVMKVKGAAEPQEWVQSRVRPQYVPQFLFQHTKA